MDIARPATDSSQSHHPVVLVHQFTSASSALASDGVLAAGLSLVNAASTASATSRWVPVRRTTPLRLPFLSKTANTYELSAKPVTIDSRAGGVQSAPQLKEWGMPLTQEDDLFILAELDEFVSTDFSYLDNLMRVKTSHIRESSDEHAFRAPKRRKVDGQSLLHIIPQPHIHPSSSTPSPTRVDTPPYRETTPLPIPPYALSPSALSANARTAWLVPIRGKLPWEGCTSACVLRSSERVPRPPVPATDNEIAWTHGAVRAFWTYLLDVRMRHGAGAVALSFHGTRAPVQPLSTRTSHDHTSVSAGRHHHHTASPPTPRSADRPGSFPSLATVVRRPQLSAVDYIKVYHAATEAMYLRNLIHLWTYKPPTDADDRAEIRLLRGAALVLLDERSRGVLIS